MKPPKHRIAVERSSNNDKRKLHAPVPSTQDREALAARASYAGSGKHKLEPRAFHLKPAPPDADDSFCDGHAGFEPADMERVGDLLERGILAGLIGHRDVQGDPTILWSVDDNGWIYELRITVPTQAIYHGYPLLVGDAFAKKVISSYNRYVYAHPQLGLEPSLENARELYAS